MNIKRLVFTLSFVGCTLVVANEDHLILVPKPIWDGESISIVQIPFISGFGCDFEGYCPKIAQPYHAERNSPSRREKDNNQEDINPASIAGIQLSVKLGADSIYDVTICYDKVKDEHWRDDAKLLRALVQCIYQYGDSVAGDFKVRFKLTGTAPDSMLHTELTQYIEDRKKTANKSKPVAAEQRNTRPELKPEGNPKSQP